MPKPPVCFPNFFFSQEISSGEAGVLIFMKLLLGLLPCHSGIRLFLEGGRCFFQRDVWWLLWVFFPAICMGKINLLGRDHSWYFFLVVIRIAKTRGILPQIHTCKGSLYFYWENQSWPWSCFVYFELDLVLTWWCFKTANSMPPVDVGIGWGEMEWKWQVKWHKDIESKS